MRVFQQGDAFLAHPLFCIHCTDHWHPMCMGLDPEDAQQVFNGGEKKKSEFKVLKLL